MVRSTRDLDSLASRGSEGWVAGALIAVMLFSITASVTAANWVEGISLTFYAAMAGLLFGGLVARLRLPGRLAHPLMLLEAVFVTAYLVSSLVQPSWATWNEKLLIMELRLGRWAGAVFSGGIGTDTLLFVMLLVALSWLLGYVAAWSVFRAHQPWGAILPGGIALLLNLFYAPPQPGVYLMAFLLSAMLLLVRTTLLKREETWRKRSIRYASDIGFDFLTYGIVFSGLVILASWVVPPTAPGPQWVTGITDNMRGPWQDVSDNVSRMFSTVRNVNSGGPSTVFGSTLSLGGPIRLGNRPVFDIEATQGRYWRAVTFDRYTGVGWVTTAGQTVDFNTNDQRMLIAPVALSRVVTQTVQVLLPGDNLVVGATEPLQVSVPVTARYAVLRASNDASYFDFASLRMQKPPREGDVYTVVSRVTGADEAALRDARPTIPSFIAARYLQLPPTVPARVRDLAVQVTAEYDNNYDKAVAIQQYLRSHIKYDESVAAPPPDRDAVDYTLFERPAGYCNYYASVMAVMAREIGIPARLVSGWATGASDNGVYHVNEADAHAWPELYFGDLGWIQFEPTASKPEIQRPVKRDEENPVDDAAARTPRSDTPRVKPRNLAEEQPDPANLGPVPGATSSAANPALVTVGTLAGLALLLSAAVGVVQVSWLRHVRLLRPGARAWEEMFRFAHLAGFREQRQATPDERAAQLERILPRARDEIRQVAEVYVRERYGARTISSNEQARLTATRTILRRNVMRGILARAWTVGPLRVYGALVGLVRGTFEEISRLAKSAGRWSNNG